MALDLQNEETHELAAELARVTGRSMAAVVNDALRSQLDQYRRSQVKEARVQELMEIGRRCAAHIHQPVSAVRHGELLYGEFGKGE